MGLGCGTVAGTPVWATQGPSAAVKVGPGWPGTQYGWGVTPCTARFCGIAPRQRSHPVSPP